MSTRISVDICTDQPILSPFCKMQHGDNSQIVIGLLQTRDLQPNVILMDLKMPGMNGIDATRRIHEVQPNIGVLVITMFDDDDSVFAAMRAGARGYLLKDADKDEVVRAIVAVERGGAIFSPTIAKRMMQYFFAPSALSNKKISPTNSPS